MFLFYHIKWFVVYFSHVLFIEDDNLRTCAIDGIYNIGYNNIISKTLNREEFDHENQTQ